MGGAPQIRMNSMVCELEMSRVPMAVLRADSMEYFRRDGVG